MRGRERGREGVTGKEGGSVCVRETGRECVCERERVCEGGKEKCDRHAREWLLQRGREGVRV